jgi:predicted LPLAT superfamily acyltransferase
MKLCAIIPSHNHYLAIGPVIAALRAQDLPVFVIDDGSDEPARSALATLHNPAQHIYVLRLPANRGKGGAVIAGFRHVIAQGYSHALQIDADGQHDLTALPELIAQAHLHPDALISGAPVYDDTAPKSRTIGRWVTHIWVWIETLSLRIGDSMCGFRIYPLEAVSKLINAEKIGAHMQFDTEIMVRLFWRGTAPVMVPVRVFYPVGNSSNFTMLRDNLRISWMHTRLFCTMLLRLPSILAHRPPATHNAHWSKLAERGTYAGLWFTARLCSLLGKRACLFLTAPIILYFYANGTKQRHAIRDFLTRALRRPVGFRDCFRVYMNFLERSLDVLLAWAEKMPADSIDDPQKILDNPRGGLIAVSHLGNSNLAHAMLSTAQRKRMVILTHTSHAAHFNRVLSDFNPDAAINIFQVTEIGPETIIALRQYIDAGCYVVIAGDRTPVSSRTHTGAADFLGAPALFPQGPWILAALLDCPVYLLFCLKEGEKYRLTIESFAERVTLPRDARNAALQDYIGRYAARLEHYAATYPFQWYNFFDFWDPT